MACLGIKHGMEYSAFLMSLSGTEHVMEHMAYSGTEYANWDPRLSWSQLGMCSQLRYPVVPVALPSFIVPSTSLVVCAKHEISHVQVHLDNTNRAQLISIYVREATGLAVVGKAVGTGLAAAAKAAAALAVICGLGPNPNFFQLMSATAGALVMLSKARTRCGKFDRNCTIWQVAHVGKLLRDARLKT
jgi:hypothetical protein